MYDNQIILTNNGFKLLHELQPNKDYLVTKSGNLTKFIGFGDVCNVDNKLYLNTGEVIYLSGDTIVDVDIDCDIKHVDIDMLMDKTPVVTNKVNYVDLKSLHKPGFSHEQCYNMGFKRNFNPLREIDFTLLSINQKKMLIAGLIDNGETLLEYNQIVINNLEIDIVNIIVFIIRSLGFDVCAKRDSIYFKPNTKIGMLPVKSITKRKLVMHMLYTSNKDAELQIEHIEECPIIVGQELIVAENEPILIGYSLLPIIQKR